jgi:amino acid adenylation domain-containing protein
VSGTDHEAFWRDYLAGHTLTRLPRWAAEPAAAEVCSAITVPGVLSWLSATLREPPQRLVLAAFVWVVGMLAAETDVTIGHRAAPSEPAAPLRVRLSGGSWRDLIGMVKAAERAVAGHRGCPPRATRPPFDVGFGPGLRTGAAQAALAVACAGGRISLSCDGQLFDAEYLARFGGYLTAAMTAMAADPAAPGLEADLLSPSERGHLVHGRAGQVRSLPQEHAHELFARRARERPGAIAVVHRDQQWTYDRVNRGANRIAHTLLAAGLRAEDVVGVATERGPDWLCAVLGVLKAGGCYLPVEPDLPAARVDALASRANVRFLLTEPGGLAALAGTPGLWSRPARDLLHGDQPDADPAVAVGMRQMAYVYFTSGSTGVPKGAMCEHLGMINHFTAKTDDFGIGRHDVIVQNALQSFDISLWQLIAPLTVGGRTLILPADDILDVRRLADAVVAGGATILQVVPSYLDVLLRFLEENPRGLGRLRQVCVTGEAISKPLVNRWFASYPQITLVNAYGATEASDDTTHEVMSAPPPGELVPVGRPVGNVTVYVLGPGDGLRPLGTPGEIAFSGICVGRGYINDPERTAEAFAADPFRPGERMYRTGDYGRWLPGGSLEFHGRRDEQVKIHGVRIELGEVESRAREHPLVIAASVVAAPLPGAGKQLVVFYTCADGLEPADLREHLAGSLPASAMPARIERIGELPLTANGKVDKRLLASRALRALAPPAMAQRVQPRTPTQQRIAEAWAKAMNRPVEDIGCDDSFFELGGSSLSALRVVAGLDGLISLDDLVRNPVLSALASAADGAGREPGGLLRLMAGPAAAPSAALVCVPYAAGAAISFQALAAAIAALDDGLAVYALQPPGHDLGRRYEPLVELDELTKLMAGEVGAIDAPVAVWGHCAGVAAALETARLLGSQVRHVFVAARLLESGAALAREVAAVAAATDIDLGIELAAGGGLGGLAEAGLSRADQAFIGRVYRHDTRIANQYLIQAPQTWRQQRLACRVTVVAAASDPLTSGFGERFGAWGAFSDEVARAELDDGGHYFPRTRPEQTAELILRALRRTA